MTLYKYRAIDKNTLNILINREIYFSLSKYFNDPFDSQLLPGDYIKSLIKMGIYDTTSANYFDEENLKDAQNKHGIYCLSKDNDSLLMWSHYAESHTGICFGFRDNFSNHIEDEMLVDTINMEYISEKEHVFSDVYKKLLNDDYHDESGRFDIVCSLHQDTLSALFGKKHEHWIYENEVRLIAEENGVFNFSPEGLECIIFGMRISKQDKATILSLLDLPQWKNVKVYQANPKRFELALEIKEHNLLGTS
ncbi:DUF2971 domain-containing protein [Aliivibrio wodanis]|uniref:DUF2971 domain-containing protein n=1 Tax=Aliivibrio wodanis TaxID=80852 RepID=UPI00406C9845